jgi:hypothetical protein
MLYLIIFTTPTYLLFKAFLMWKEVTLLVKKFLSASAHSRKSEETDRQFSFSAVSSCGMNLTDKRLIPISTVKIPFHKTEEISCSTATSLMEILVFHQLSSNHELLLPLHHCSQQRTSRPISMFCHRSMDACPAPRQQIHSKLIQLTASS